MKVLILGNKLFADDML